MHAGQGNPAQGFPQQDVGALHGQPSSGQPHVTTLLHLQPVDGPSLMTTGQQANGPALQANGIPAQAPGQPTAQHLVTLANQIPTGAPILASLASQQQQQQQQSNPQQAGSLVQQAAGYLVHWQPGPGGTQMVLTLPNSAQPAAGQGQAWPMQSQAGGAGSDAIYHHDMANYIDPENGIFRHRLKCSHPASQSVRDLVTFQEALKLWQHGVEGCHAIRELERDKTWRKGNEDVKKRVSELRGYIKLINVKRWKDNISWDDAADALQREADDIIKRNRSMVSKLSGRYKLLEARYAHELAVAKAMGDDVESCPAAAAIRLQHIVNIAGHEPPQPINTVSSNHVDLANLLQQTSGRNNLPSLGSNPLCPATDPSAAGPSVIVSSVGPGAAPHQHAGCAYTTNPGATGQMCSMPDPMMSAQQASMTLNQHVDVPAQQQVFITGGSQPTFLPNNVYLPTSDVEAATPPVMYQINSQQAPVMPCFTTSQQAAPAVASRMYVQLKDQPVVGTSQAATRTPEQTSVHSRSKQLSGELKASGQVLQQAHPSAQMKQLPVGLQGYGNTSVTTLLVPDSTLAYDILISLMRNAMSDGRTMPAAAAHVVAALPGGMRQQVASLVDMPGYQPDAATAGCAATDGHTEWVNRMLIRLGLSPSCDNIQPFVKQLGNVWADKPEETRILWELFGAVVNLLEGRVTPPQPFEMTVAATTELRWQQSPVVAVDLEGVEGAAAGPALEGAVGRKAAHVNMAGQPPEPGTEPRNLVSGGGGSGGGGGGGAGSLSSASTPASTTTSSTGAAAVSSEHAGQIKQEDASSGLCGGVDDESRALKRPKV